MTFKAPEGLSKLEALHRLWRASQPARFFTMSGMPAPRWDPDAAAKDLKFDYVDYCQGRLIKSDFKNWPMMDTTGYDRDYGPGAGFKAVTQSA